MTIIPFPAKTTRVVIETGESFLITNYIPPVEPFIVNIIPVNSVAGAYAALRKIREQELI